MTPPCSVALRASPPKHPPGWLRETQMGFNFLGSRSKKAGTMRRRWLPYALQIALNLRVDSVQRSVRVEVEQLCRTFSGKPLPNPTPPGELYTRRQYLPHQEHRSVAHAVSLGSLSEVGRSHHDGA